MRDDVVEGQLDASRSHFITILGKKGSGKSVLASWFWSTYPHDALVIDPAGDARVDEEEIEDLDEPIPMRWPRRIERDLEETGEAPRPSKLRYRPDPGSPDYADDLDRAVGLAFFHPRGPRLLWIDEIAELTGANRTGPNMRRALHQGRHRQLSMLMCGPRAKHINPLVLGNADVVYVFELPHPHDQDAVAGAIGIPPRQLQAAIGGLGEFEYLRYDSRSKELLHFPPLPLSNSHVTR